MGAERQRGSHSLAVRDNELAHEVSHALPSRKLAVRSGARARHGMRPCPGTLPTSHGAHRRRHRAGDPKSPLLGRCASALGLRLEQLEHFPKLLFVRRRLPRNVDPPDVGRRQRKRPIEVQPFQGGKKRLHNLLRRGFGRSVSNGRRVGLRGHALTINQLAVS